MPAVEPVRSLGRLPDEDDFVSTMRFSQDGRLVAMTGHSTTVWEVDTGRTDDCGGTSAAAFSPDGSLLAADVREDVVLWRVASLRR